MQSSIWSERLVYVYETVKSPPSCRPGPPRRAFTSVTVMPTWILAAFSRLIAERGRNQCMYSATATSTAMVGSASSNRRRRVVTVALRSSRGFARLNAQPAAKTVEGAFLHAAGVKGGPEESASLVVGPHQSHRLLRTRFLPARAV